MSEISSPYLMAGVSDEHPVTRRQAIVRIGATSAAALAAVGGGLWLLNRDPKGPENLVVIPDHAVSRAEGSVQMAIARGKDPTVNTQKALAALGGMEAFIKRGDKVVVKPNVGWNRRAEQAANTTPEVVAEVVRQAVAAGAAEVWVTDIPVNDAERCFERSGIGKAAREAGAKVVLPEKNGYRNVAVGGEAVRVADVLWPFVDADKVINIPIVKQHSLSKATMSMKNWFGIVGGNRARLHQKVDLCIAELAALMKPTLTVLDATRVLLANGPSGGSLDDVKRCDTVAAGIDQVALDAFGTSFLGVDPKELGYLANGEKMGLGTRDYRSLKLTEITG